MMSFGIAIDQLKSGNKVYRKHWLKYWIALSESKLNFHLISHNHLSPTYWVPSHEDLLAEDWEIVR